MLDLLVASFLVAAAEDAESTAPLPEIKETLYCREILEGYSRSQSLSICRTKAAWRRWEACSGSDTRYCDKEDRFLPAGAKVGNETAFPMDEGSRIVCRILRATGTRLTGIKTCLPRREWERMWKDSARLTAELQEQLKTWSNGEEVSGR